MTSPGLNHRLNRDPSRTIIVSVRSRLRPLLALLLAAGLAVGTPEPAAADFPGQNAYVRAQYLESQGRLGEAEEAYLAIVRSNPSPAATDRALKRLLEIAAKGGDRGREMSYLIASFRAGNPNAAKRIATLQNDHKLVPKPLAELLPHYERNALAGHASSALVLAGLASQGRLAGTSVTMKSALDWYRVAAKFGTTGPLKRLVQRAVASGRDAEAIGLLDVLPPPEAAEMKVRAARTLAFETEGVPAARIAAWTARIPRKEAQSIHARLAKAAAGRGDFSALVYWMDRVDDVGGIGSVGILRRAYDAEKNPKAKAKLFEAMVDLADRGDASAASAVFKIASAEYGLADERTRPHLLRLVASGNAKATEEIVETMAFLTPGDPQTVEFFAALESSAKSGGTGAMMALAQLYAVGGPVPVDLEQSTAWYEAAADAGVAEAQYRAGLTYSNRGGTGRAKAVDWLQKAASAGHQPAKEALEALGPVTN